MSDTIPEWNESPQIKQIAAETEGLAVIYDGYEVATTEEYTAGAEALKSIKGQLARITEERLKLTRPLDESKKRIMAFFRQFTDRMEESERQVKFGLLEYKREQDRLAREQQRLERERAEKREAKLREDAEAARKKERGARADILDERADATVAAPVVSEAPKVKGISTRKIWRFEIIDVAQIPDKYKIIDEKKIGGVVRALKADADIPGVRVYAEEVMAAGRGDG